VAASGIGFSRLGANNNFTKLTAQAHATLSLAPGWSLAASAKAQTSFGAAVFRSEQFALEGQDGVSAYIGGSTAVDEGGAARLELRHQLVSGQGALGLQLAPYILAAGGAGSVAVPTILEPKSLKAAALGVGARAALTRVGLYFNLEYAHGFSGFAPLGDTDRVNVAATLQF
jgi:hemolysin activation/secretion protein